MKIGLPYSRERRYLTGIDWAIGTLDCMSRRYTGVGNLSQVILEVGGLIDPGQLTQTLAQISRRFPLIHGRVARDWMNLAPYWRAPAAADDLTIPLKIVELRSDQAGEADALFADHVNTPLQGPGEHLRMLLVHLGGQRSRLGMVFDHRLLDACGAETFLRLIDETYRGRLDVVAPAVKQTEPPHLDEWKRQFLGGRAVNRFRLQFAGSDVAGLTMPAPAPAPPRGGRTARPVRFVHDSLDPIQTAAFIQRAAEESQVPILLPAALARAVPAMQKALAATAPGGAQCLVAVSADARQTDQKWEQLLFNHLSFLGFSAPMDKDASAGELAILFRDQLFEQMKAGIPAALQDATMLTRICPHWIGARIARLPFRGRVCSFYFACLRESAFTSENFLGLPAVNLIHTPRVPPPPGIGLCMTFFGGRLNLVLSYLDGVIEGAAAQSAMRRFRELLES